MERLSQQDPRKKLFTNVATVNPRYNKLRYYENLVITNRCWNAPVALVMYWNISAVLFPPGNFLLYQALFSFYVIIMNFWLIRYNENLNITKYSYLLSISLKRGFPSYWHLNPMKKILWIIKRKQSTRVTILLLKKLVNHDKLFKMHGIKIPIRIWFPSSNPCIPAFTTARQQMVDSPDGKFISMIIVRLITSFDWL